MSTSRALLRINLGRAELTRLHNEIVEWLTRRDPDGFQQSGTRLDALDLCLRPILTALDAEPGNLASAGETLNQLCYVVLHGRLAPCDSRPFGVCAVQSACARIAERYVQALASP